MDRAGLKQAIVNKGSFLCVGLDTDVNKLPGHLPKTAEGVVAFNEAIIAATADYAVAYKLNTAFYEALGAPGWLALEATLQAIPAGLFTIADAKRGDIGNTGQQYAKAFLDTLPFDSVTVAPYMGRDSVEPFLAFAGKWAVVLGLTSNAGAADVELLPLASGQAVYEKVMATVASWGTPENLMFVVGATQADKLGHIRSQFPDHFFLVPGVGAQGGDLGQVAKAGLNDHGGLLVNSSRSIIYASSGPGFAEAAGAQARELAQQMRILLAEQGLS